MIMALLLATGSGSSAELARDEPAAVAEVLAGDLLHLADGRVVRLAGIRVPHADGDDSDGQRFAEQVRAELGALLDGHAIRLVVAEAPRDRYGRLVAQVERGDGVWIQGALLERGLARVQTRPGEVARAEQMLAIEHNARMARLGLWGEPAFRPREASAVDGASGRFQIVHGRVLRVAPTERFVYLNFGDDWRRDFTVRIAKKLARDLADSGLDVASLAGRRLEIRGLVLEAGGPLIELSHREQMQVSPAAP